MKIYENICKKLLPLNSLICCIPRYYSRRYDINFQKFIIKSEKKNKVRLLYPFEKYYVYLKKYSKSCIHIIF